MPGRGPTDDEKCQGIGDHLRDAEPLCYNNYDQKFIDSIGKVTIFTSNKSGKVDYDWLDQKVVDGFGNFANYMSLKMKKLQGGVIQSYILGGLIAVIVITLIVQQI